MEGEGRLKSGDRESDESHEVEKIRIRRGVWREREEAAGGAGGAGSPGGGAPGSGAVGGDER